MDIKLKFCSTEKITDENKLIKGLEWSLCRYVESKESKIRRSVKRMSTDLGNGININSVLSLLNSNNCFDFNYTPIEKDRLMINENSHEINYKYFSLIFKEGKWKKGDYYTSKLPYKGFSVITKNIKKGKIKRTHNNVYN